MQKKQTKTVTIKKKPAKKKPNTKTKPKINIAEPISDFISIVMLCDTPGYRMKSYGLTCMIDINDKYKLIDYHIALINKCFKNCEIILCTGFDSEKIQKYILQKYASKNVRIIENQLSGKVLTCESMRLAINNITNSKLMVLDGNLIFDEKLFDKFIANNSYVFVSDKSSKELDIGVNINEKGEIEYFSYGGNKQWSEVLYLHNADIINAFRKILNNREYKNKFIFEALNELIKYNFKISCQNKSCKITKINNIKIYHQIRIKNEVFN